MKNYYKTLIIEDHGLTTAGIEAILQKVAESAGITFETYFAAKCSQALSILKREPLIDLIFLDIKLPPEPDIGMHSGENLGIEIRKLYPKALIIVITAYNQTIRTKRILNTFKPEGFIIKGDIDYLSLASEIEKAVLSPPYYSPSVVKAAGKILTFSPILDTLDTQLLLELDKGLVMKEIADQLFLSRVAVVKRKQKLKLLFEVEEGNDRDLVNKARDLGFI